MRGTFVLTFPTWRPSRGFACRHYGKVRVTLWLCRYHVTAGRRCCLATATRPRSGPTGSGTGPGPTGLPAPRGVPCHPGCFITLLLPLSSVLGLPEAPPAF